MEVIPEKKLKYGWRYNGYAGNSFVTYDLSAEDEKTKLTLTHQGIETFPATANTDLIYKLAQYFTIGIYQTLPHKSYMKFQPTHIGLK